MERKYFTEFGLGVHASYKSLLPIEQLDEFEKYDKRKYHIYFILAHSKYFFVKDKTYVTKDGIKLTILESENNKENEYELPIWKLPEGIDYNHISLYTSFPYSSITIENNDKKFLKEHPNAPAKFPVTAQLIFDLHKQYIKDVCKYEVLYIGQSYGKRGERTAQIRLSSHSKLQEILIDAQSKYTNKHIYILLLEMTPRLSMSFDGISKQYTKSDEEDEIHRYKVMSDLPREQQVINITEAAMINYFKPPYNINYVENFPDENHKGYKQYYNLDYNSLIVEIDLDFDDAPTIQIYSKANMIRNSMVDFIQYNLYNDTNRKDMYDIFKDNK